MAETGGYDACFVQPLSDRHTCPICQLAFRIPKMTDCGHQFCEGCLRPLIYDDKVCCPTCRRLLRLDEIYPNNMAKRDILSLKILCDEHEVGCQWTGELSDRKQHGASCSYSRELCDNECGEKVMRKDMEKHKKDVCSRRIVVCSYCYEQMQYAYISEHLDIVCDAFPVPCICQCGTAVIRGEMNAHTGKSGTCTKSCRHCDFKHVGCHFKGNRLQLESHHAHATVSHLSMVASSFQSRLETAEKSLDESWEKLNETREELDQTRKELDKNREELNKTKEKLDETRQELNKTKQKLSETEK